MRLLALLFIAHFFCLARAQKIDAVKIINEARSKLETSNTISFTANSAGTGSREGKVLVVKAQVFIQRRTKEFPLVLVTGSVLKPLFDKYETERIVYDGNHLYNYDFENSFFIDRGPINEAEKYLGFSSIVWKYLIGNDPFKFSETTDTAVFESKSEANDRLCHVILIKRKSYNSRIFIDKQNLMPVRIANLTSAPDAPGSYQFDYSNIEIDKPLNNAIFTVSNIGSANKADGERQELKAQQTNLLSVGSKAPDWKLNATDGSEFSLKECLGKIVIMDFSASWCAPCKLYEKSLINFYEQNKASVLVLGMSYNETKTDSDLKDYLKQKGISYPFLPHAEKIAQKYNVLSIPTLYVLVEDGSILFRVNGYSEAGEKQMYDSIKRRIDSR